MVSAAATFAVERQLDRLVEKLSGRDASASVRGLLIEVRRLRASIANWRAVPPIPRVREEMLARVLHISAAVGEAVHMEANQQAESESNHKSAIVRHGRASVRERASTATLAGGFALGPLQGHAIPEAHLDLHTVKLEEPYGPHLVMFSEPHGKRADAYRALRHRLAHTGDPRVIAITSAGRGEGKTTAAINLAAALRESARGRVLLVEANLRAPAVATRLGFIPPVCFGEQLVKHRRSTHAAWTAADLLEPLHVMAVSPDWDQSPLIDPIAFAIAIEQLRTLGYDYIVVDTPPVLESADVNLIADSVDGLVMTALAKKSNTKAIKRAMNQIGTMAFLGTLLLE